jgi:solute carrier family 25 carnitine/acylcarnitine transporter 20/29
MAEGIGVFFKGLGICSARAFFVNAVQWAVSIRTPIFLKTGTKERKGVRVDDDFTS